MKVARAEDQKRRQRIQLFGGESFNLAGRRRESQTRSPAAKVPGLESRTNFLAPGVIEIQMKHRIIEAAHEKESDETRAGHNPPEQIVAMPTRNNHGRSDQQRSKPKTGKAERDIFCRVQDAFRIVA